ncbi:MAG: hypothetical protein QOG04_2112 [Actinomycetota bacterium]|jgi:uncharacterized membrane protein YidH (DUF202 family)|nr:hypothetical protein [Actinomycetota bacterium]
MGIGASLFLIALGAILTFAVDVATQGFNINTIGVILMIVGGLGLVLTMLFWSDSAPMRRRGTTVVREDREVI